MLTYTTTYINLFYIHIPTNCKYTKALELFGFSIRFNMLGFLTTFTIYTFVFNQCCEFAR